MKSLNLQLDWDLSEIERNFPRLDKALMAGMRKGVCMALAELMRDICEEIPTAPIRTGRLRGSMTYFVNRVFKGGSERYGPPLYQQPVNTEPKDPHATTGMLVVNAPYATIQHERYPVKRVGGDKDTIHPTAGMFYVLRKLIMFRTKYMDMVVAEMRRSRI